MATLQELLDQQVALSRQIADLKKSERSKTIEQVRALMAEHGLTTADLSGPAAARKSAPGARRKVAAKYRHPESGQTWSGRGLKPKWLTEEIGKGKTLDDFAV